MRRFPALLLALTASAWPARAEALPEPLANVDAPAAAGAQAPVAAPVAAEPVPVATAANTPTLAVPQKINGEVVDKPGGFPLHATISMDNAIGSSVYATTATADHPVIVNGAGGPQVLDVGQRGTQASWSTEVLMSGSASVPKLDYLPKISLSTSLTLSMSNWISSETSDAVYDRIVRVSDIGVGLKMPALWTEEYTKISVSPSISGKIPISLTSRQSQLITLLGAGVGFAWSAPEQPWGTIEASYAPKVSFPIFAGVAATQVGVTDQTVHGFTANPLQNPNAFPVLYCRDDNVFANGECTIAGRQTLMNLSNSLGVSWKLGAHSVALSLAHSLAFKRDLAPNPALSSDYASGQNFEKEATKSSISYSYELPIELADISLSAGIASSQPVHGGNNELLFPFWDFVTPSKNYSAAFFDVSVGL